MGKLDTEKEAENVGGKNPNPFVVAFWPVFSPNSASENNMGGREKSTLVSH